MKIYPERSRRMKIYLGADHGGFELKEKIKKYLESKGFEVEDFGPKSLDPEDDYPDYSVPVAKAVSKNPDFFGILLCRSGQGVCVVANKFRNIRAGLTWNEKVAQAGRNDDNLNVLCLPADYVSEIEAKKIIRTFIETPFSGQEHHQKRIDKIIKLEQNGKTYSGNFD